jgi:pyroglutamyl-peptidase
MLRRKRRTPKLPPAAPAGVSTTRRRPRPGAQVPSELIISGEPALGTAEKPAPKRAGERKQKVVLVTGFDAFCGERINPSWQVCEQLPKEIEGLRVETVYVPCEFGRAIEVVAKAIERTHPSLVICLGQAGGRAHLSVERVAINVKDARLEDNAGMKPVDEPVVPDGPPAYFSTLPIKAIVQAMHAAGVPAEVSNSAGTYVCNHLMYGVLHHLYAKSPSRARAGFIHVPYSEEQVIDKPSISAMSVATMVKGVAAAIVAANRHHEDLKIGGGTLD